MTGEQKPGGLEGDASGVERGESAGDMLSRLGMDGKLWAEEFQKTALTLGYPEMDDGWLLGWFCNAIMAGYDHARRKYDPEILAHFRPQPSGETREAVLSETEAKVLLAMDGDWDDDFGFRHTCDIAGNAEVASDLCKAVLTVLRLRGLVDLRKGLLTEEGRAFGSGWQITNEGHEAVKALLSARPLALGSQQGEVAEWRSGEGAPVYPKGTVVSYRGRHFRALRDVKASAKTNAPNYSGFWEEVK